jgi:hypothetical protein
VTDNEIMALAAKHTIKGRYPSDILAFARDLFAASALDRLTAEQERLGLYESDYVVAALVAAGHVPKDKVNEAYALARKYAVPAASAKQEPVGWFDTRFEFDNVVWGPTKPSYEGKWEPLYAAPSAKQEPTLEQALNDIAYGGIPHNDARIRCAKAMYGYMRKNAQSVMSDDSGDALKALKAAKQFIENGVEFGYIRMPRERDPAHHTLPLIDSAIAAIKAQSEKTQ